MAKRRRLPKCRHALETGFVSPRRIKTDWVIRVITVAGAKKRGTRVEQGQLAPTLVKRRVTCVLVRSLHSGRHDLQHSTLAPAPLDLAHATSSAANSSSQRSSFLLRRRLQVIAQHRPDLVRNVLSQPCESNFTRVQRSNMLCARTSHQDSAGANFHDTQSSRRMARLVAV